MFSRRTDLEARIADLDARIAIERARSAPDEVLLKSWDISRLALEDEAARIDRSAWRQRRKRRYGREFA